MKKYNLFKVIAITVIVAWLLTLMIPGSSVDYSGNITATSVAGGGIFGLLSNLGISISYFNGIAVLLISVACLYAVLEKVSVYENFVCKVTKLFENKKGLFITLTIILFGILSMLINDFMILLVFVPFIYKVMGTLEIDKKVMLSSTLVAALIGAMCCIYNSTLFSMFSLSINTLLLVKVILFVVSIAVLIILIAPKKEVKLSKKQAKLSKKEEKTKVVQTVSPKTNTKKVNKIAYAILTILFGSFGINKMYAGQIKSGVLRLLFCWTLIPSILSVAEFITILTEKSDKNGKIDVISKRRQNVSFAVLLIIFVLFVIGCAIPWESLINKLTIFTDLNIKLSELKIGQYSLFNNIIGAPVVKDATYGTTTGVIGIFGTWTTLDLSLLLFVITLIIAIANNLKVNEFIAIITSGTKKILPVALTAMLISIVLIMMVTTGVNITITNFILSLTKGFNIVTSTIASLVGSLLTADFYYFTSTVGSVFSSVITNKDYYGVVAFILQTIYNFAMLVAPTSVGLVIGLYYLNIPYDKWLKHIWKLLAILFVTIIITVIIMYVLI